MIRPTTDRLIPKKGEELTIRCQRSSIGQPESAESAEDHGWEGVAEYEFKYTANNHEESTTEKIHADIGSAQAAGPAPA